MRVIKISSRNRSIIVTDLYRCHKLQFFFARIIHNVEEPLHSLVHSARGLVVIIARSFPVLPDKLYLHYEQHLNIITSQSYPSSHIDHRDSTKTTRKNTWESILSGSAAVAPTLASHR